MASPILVAKGKTDHCLLPEMANRHGLTAGATGTGKTVTLRVMAEGFSRIGVPVFMSDVKGDLAGICRPGTDESGIGQRAAKLGLKDFKFTGYPVTFWDVFGEQGHPMRATVSEMGPLLLGRVFNLNDTQGGVLSLAFKVADDNGLLLLDLKDLRAMLTAIGNHSSALRTQYGNVSTASVGAIQRRLLELEQQGGTQLLGEPALTLDDLIQTDSDGRGMINILAADRLLQAPQTYATFLLWLLSELFETLPEVGDREKPKLVFFFDEVHLLFEDAPPALLDKIEQVVRLIRSKGVGVYFVTQNPLDVPDVVLGQLGNRVQHALRAYTPRDQKAVNAAATTFRANPSLKVESVITELAVGEALVSFLDEQGTPGIVDRAMILPPQSLLGALPDAIRREVIQRSVLYGHYETAIDRESAYEQLAKRRDQGSSALPVSAATPAQASPVGPIGKEAMKLLNTVVTSAARGVGFSLGRQIVRGVLGSILGGSRGRSRW